MKKTYEAPVLEVEVFELNSSVAAGCDTIVDYGPDPSQNDEGKTCDYFGNPFESATTAESMAFYESSSSTCDCYYSSGNMNYVTS